MTPEQSNQMLSDIASIKTLLTQLVGVNGNNGRFGDLEAKVDEHQTYIDQQKGAGRLVHYGVTVVASACTALFTKYFSGRL